MPERNLLPGRLPWAPSDYDMKKDMKELLRTFVIAFMVMMVVPVAYQVFIHIWPPEEKPHQTLTQFLEETQMARCVKLLTTPAAKWADAEVKSEPKIYAWLKEQGNEILPWEWTEEARRKDPGGYEKCWRRVWKERKTFYERRLSEYQKEAKRLDRELQVLATIYAHRTNQIARLRAFAATNVFPCRISIERLEKGCLWGWNRIVKVVECKDAVEVVSATNSICSVEIATAEGESRRAAKLTDLLTSSKEKSALSGKLSGICDRSTRLIENGLTIGQDEHLQKSLVEVLKGSE